MDIIYPPDFKGEWADCLKDCVDAHERKHMRDLRREDPNVCKNISRGYLPRFDSASANGSSERGAYDAELECLKKKLNGASADCACIPHYERRIKDIPNERRRYE